MRLAPHCSCAPSSVRNAREASLQVSGAQLFNCIPRDQRDTSAGTNEQFKFKLDQWLSTIPDQPTISGRQRAAASNSLLAQLQYPSELRIQPTNGPNILYYKHNSYFYSLTTVYDNVLMAMLESTQYCKL